MIEQMAANRRASAASDRRRGATLIEAIIAVVVLGIAVPPTLSMLMQASAVRADAVAATRATLYAQAVMEQVLADVCSPDDVLGFDAFADDVAYRSGLETRLAPVSEAYAHFGMSHDLSIGPLTDHAGVSTNDPSLDVYRRVVVSIRFTDATDVRTLTVEHVLTELSP